MVYSVQFTIYILQFTKMGRRWAGIAQGRQTPSESNSGSTG